MSDIPAALPDGAEAYGRSPDFFHDRLPDKLRSAHTTKAGTWGLIHVLEGALLYQLEAPYHGETRVAAGETAVIAPEVPHRVRFVEEPGRFFVEFYRRANG